VGIMHFGGMKRLVVVGPMTLHQLIICTTLTKTSVQVLEHIGVMALQLKLGTAACFNIASIV
jgi:hypothetical protein